MKIILRKYKSKKKKLATVTRAFAFFYTKNNSEKKTMVSNQHKSHLSMDGQIAKYRSNGPFTNCLVYFT